MSTTRREYMAASATPAFLGLGWGPLGSGDDEESVDYDGYAPTLEEFPEHLHDIRADIEELEDYQPKLILTPEARSEIRGMYGWSCESEEFDVTAHYYWARYNTQRSALAYIGLDVDLFDAHYLDHEPTIVFANPDGTVDQVVTTGGHHYSIEIGGEWGNITEDRVSDRRTHVNLVGVRPWNHYMEAPSGREGSFVQNFGSFGSWLNQYETWFRNGRYSSTADIAVLDPFTFYDDGERDDVRGHWWESDTWDAWAARHIRMRAISDRDNLRIED